MAAGRCDHFARLQVTDEDLDIDWSDVPDDKVKRADYAFTNTGSLEELDGFVASVMNDLTE